MGIVNSNIVEKNNYDLFEKDISSKITDEKILSYIKHNPRKNIMIIRSDFYPHINDMFEYKKRYNQNHKRKILLEDFGYYIKV